MTSGMRTLYRPRAARARPALRERLATILRRVRARARLRRELACLDDRLLHDAGLSRHELEAEAHRPWWRA